MTDTIVHWFREGRARALAIGAALLLVLAPAGCSETGDDTGGSESGNAGQEAARETTVEGSAAEETTVAPTTGSEEREESGEEGEERARQGSSGSGEAVSEQEPQPQSEPEQASPEQDSEREASGLASRGQVVTVTRVVDGDSIEVSPAVDGLEDVRLIGVDTPETYGGAEPMGAQASAYTGGALTGRQVALEFDEERIDPYGRVLAYVWTSEEAMFNSQLLRTGLAQVATFPPNTRYVAQFESMQRQAQAENRGIWGLSQAQQCELADRGNGIGEGTPGCGGASESRPGEPDSPQAPQQQTPQQQTPAQGGGSAPPVSEDDCPASHPVKGNEDSGIYHPPSGGSYSVINPEVCFASPAAAEAAGYRAAQN